MSTALPYFAMAAIYVFLGIHHWNAEKKEKPHAPQHVANEPAGKADRTVE